MTQAVADTDFQGRMRQLEDLLQEVQAITDPVSRGKMSQIIQTLMEFHGAGLRSIVEHLQQSGSAGQSVMQSLLDDDLVSSLFLLYELHPLDLSTRVGLALEQVRPYLASHHGNVELLGISDQGVVRLRMAGSCHGCPSSAATLKSTIEQAIYEKAPDVAAIELDGVEAEPQQAPAGFVPIEQLIGNTRKHHLPQGATSC